MVERFRRCDKSAPQTHRLPDVVWLEQGAGAGAGMAKRNLVNCRVGSLLLLRQSNTSPTDAEWNSTLTLLAEIRAEGLTAKVLVVTDGAGPDAKQRARLETLLAGKPVRTAVVSDSLKLRFISAGVALFNPGHRAFARAELQEAYAYLGLTPNERRDAEKALVDMHPKVS
jgi:hypothetical protein